MSMETFLGERKEQVRMIEPASKANVQSIAEQGVAIVDIAKTIQRITSELSALYLSIHGLDASAMIELRYNDDVSIFMPAKNVLLCKQEELRRATRQMAEHMTAIMHEAPSIHLDDEQDIAGIVQTLQKRHDPLEERPRVVKGSWLGRNKECNFVSPA